MESAVIKVVPDRPDAKRGNRTLLRDLLEAVQKVVKPGWHRLAEFPDNPRRAHWYAARLKNRHPGGYEFCATTTDGIGKVFCRKGKAHGAGKTIATPAGA